MIIILPQNYNEIVYPWGFSGSYFSSDQLFQFHQIYTTYDNWRQTFAPENLQEIEIKIKIKSEKTPVFHVCATLGWSFYRRGGNDGPAHVINQPTIPTNTAFQICIFWGICSKYSQYPAHRILGGQIHPDSFLSGLFVIGWSSHLQNLSGLQNACLQRMTQH